MPAEPPTSSNGAQAAGARDARLRFSIVIPVHNRAGLTQACIDALLEQRPAETEILVVDDGSTDSTPELLRSYGDAIRVVQLDARGGFGGACNAAAAEAAGRYLVLLNNDTLPVAGWLEALGAHADAHPKAAVIGCKLLWLNHTVQHAGVVFDQRHNPHHLYAGFPAEHPAVNKSRRLQAVTGAAMLVCAAAFEELGRFDSRFVNGFEDVDLCLRAAERGWEVRCCHESVLYHLEGATRSYRYEGDHPNWRQFRERWADRVICDDVQHYAEDGLVSFAYEPEGREMTVTPLLATVSGGPANELERALTERTRACADLIKESVRLATAGDAPVDAWSAVVSRQAAVSASSISVVIPVSDHGDPEASVKELRRQAAGRDGFEVLVVEGDRAGRAGAFNDGIHQAKGDLVLLLADDFMPDPGLLDEHLALHRRDPRRNVAGLGPAFFSSEIRADPFARWLEDSGQLFGVSFTRAGDRIDPSFFWGGNVSLKRSFLLEGRLFDERFPDEAWDDYELGLRLFARGLQVEYLPGASARHEHRLTLAERTAVMRKGGRAVATLDALYPRPHRWNSAIDPAFPITALRLAAQRARARHLLRRREADLQAYWRYTLERALLEGYREHAW